MLSICIEKQTGRKLSIISGISEDVIYLVETSRELLRTYKIRLPIPPPALYYIESSSTNIGGFSFVSPLTSSKIPVIRMILRNPSNFFIFHSKISILLSLLICILLQSSSYIKNNIYFF